MGSNRHVGLDAIRAAAISLVLMAHCAGFLNGAASRFGIGFTSFTRLTGILGVEVFFSLSGFLIGAILLEIEHRGASTANVGAFVIRRWMRTFPLYFLILGALILFPSLDPNERSHIWLYAVMAQNLWTPMPDGNWFGPSWSLVIEEWTYLLLPLLAFGLLHPAKQGVLLAALMMCVAGLAFRYMALDDGAAWGPVIRKMFLSRIDAIAYGVILAWLQRQHGTALHAWARRLAPLSLASLAVLVWQLNNEAFLDSMPGRVFALPLLAIAVCALIPVVMRLQYSRPIASILVFVSGISYSHYLVHWPLMFIAYRAHSMFGIAIFLIGSVAVATMLTYAIEQPVMRRRPRQFPSARAPDGPFAFAGG